MEQLDRVKLFLGIVEDSQDDLIEEIIKQSEKQLKNLIESDELPDELEYVVTDLVIMRYNRLGSEGMESESIEGHSIKYAKNDLVPYSQVLNKYLPDDADDSTKGEVLFY